MIIYTLLLIVFLISIILLSKNIENYSSLDTIYSNKFKKPNPDICDECGGLCQYCNHGFDKPSNCNRSASNYKQGYLNPQDVNLNAIDSPKDYKCVNDKILNKLISANYVYIYSNAFNKTLSFESYGNKSYVYLDNKIPTNDDCLTKTQFNSCCEFLDSNVANIPQSCKNSPQKWRIDIKNHFNTNICLVTISSYNCNGLKYYLSANEDGSVDVSLFEGSDNQVWQIYKNIEKDDNTTGENIYLIKSHKYCTYLTSNSQGYMKRKSGTISLTNINKNKIGKEVLWNIDECGKRKLINNSYKNSYKPFQSTTDFPYVNDDIGPKNVLPKDLKVLNDINKKWAGRSIWMKEFSKVWNDNYNYETYIKENYLSKIKNNEDQEQLYKIDTKIKLIKPKINIDLNDEGKGIVNIEILETKIETREVPGKIVTYAGLIKQRTYKHINNKIVPLKFNVVNIGANILEGSNKNDNIFIENIDKNRIRVTIKDKDNIKLSAIAKKN